MRMPTLASLFGLAALATTGACVVRTTPGQHYGYQSQGYVSGGIAVNTPSTFYVESAPPEPLYETVSASPGGGNVWIDGYWHWNGYEWVWVSGRWVRDMEGYIYVSPYYDYDDSNRYAYHSGYWSRPDRVPSGVIVRDHRDGRPSTGYRPHETVPVRPHGNRPAPPTVRPDTRPDAPTVRPDTRPDAPGPRPEPRPTAPPTRPEPRPAPPPATSRPTRPTAPPATRPEPRPAPPPATSRPTRPTAPPATRPEPRPAPPPASSRPTRPTAPPATRPEPRPAGPDTKKKPNPIAPRPTPTIPTPRPRPPAAGPEQKKRANPPRPRHSALLSGSQSVALLTNDGSARMLSGSGLSSHALDLETMPSLKTIR